jgi:hypothetical protein
MEIAPPHTSKPNLNLLAASSIDGDQQVTSGKCASLVLVDLYIIREFLSGAESHSQCCHNTRRSLV